MKLVTRAYLAVATLSLTGLATQGAAGAENDGVVQERIIARLSEGAKRHQFSRGAESPQSVFAAVVTCAGFPIPPEELFDRKPGELYVVQGGGTTTAVKNVNHAIASLHVPLVVVLGGEACSRSGAERMSSPDDLRKTITVFRQSSAVIREAEAAGYSKLVAGIVDSIGRVKFLGEDQLAKR